MTIISIVGDQHILLDISRLLSRVRHLTPSGVDRVEMAYARGLYAHYGERLHFAAVHPFGCYGRLRRKSVIRFLDLLEARWNEGDGSTRQRPIVDVLPTLLGLLPYRSTPLEGAIYVQSSPHHLDKPALVKRILARERAKFLCLVHDLIPIEYPEYARPAGAAQHRTRISTIVELADSVIVNSAATGQSLKDRYLEGRQIDVRVALLGTRDIAHSIKQTLDVPFFLCVGTIEPRKNHLLLLNLWRQMAETMEARTIPRLVIVGRRGWENEQIVDMLDRCPALKGHVEEINGCSDQKMYGLLRNARALLMPSFAEGYGMPVAEALSIGTPVIASDLPALREAGGVVPDFLDPLDGLSWKAHIIDYCCSGALYAAQMTRMNKWHRPNWQDHFRIVCDAIHALQR